MSSASEIPSSRFRLCMSTLGAVVPNGHLYCFVELWDVCGEGFTLHALSLAFFHSLSSSFFLSFLLSLDIFKKSVLLCSVDVLGRTLTSPLKVKSPLSSAEEQTNHIYTSALYATLTRCSEETLGRPST